MAKMKKEGGGGMLYTASQSKSLFSIKKMYLSIGNMSPKK